MSGGGGGFNPVKSITGGGIGGLIGGAAFGPAGSVIGGALGGSGMKMPSLGGRVDVPGATAKAEWNLSGPDGKLRSDLLLGSDIPKAATQSQGVLDQLVADAQSTGPSKSAQYLQDANKRNMNNSLDQAEAQGRGSMASITSNLAMRGGLDSGARERIGKASGFETMMNKQRVMNDAQGADLNILAQDESNKQATLKALPASLLAQAGFTQGNKQFDIQNTLNTVGGKYNADMAAWGANQAAREQAQLANKKDGMLGLGIMGIL